MVFFGSGCDRLYSCCNSLLTLLHSPFRHTLSLPFPLIVAQLTSEIRQLRLLLSELKDIFVTMIEQLDEGPRAKRARFESSQSSDAAQFSSATPPLAENKSQVVEVQLVELQPIICEIAHSSSATPPLAANKSQVVEAHLIESQPSLTSKLCEIAHSSSATPLLAANKSQVVEAHLIESQPSLNSKLPKDALPSSATSPLAANKSQVVEALDRIATVSHFKTFAKLLT